VDSLATNQELVMLGLRLHLKDEHYTYKYCTYRVADPHHLNVDPDPSFQIKAQNLKKYLTQKGLFSIHFGFHLKTDEDADPDPAYHSDDDADTVPSL
jgi:hypothetical protein